MYFRHSPGKTYLRVLKGKMGTAWDLLIFIAGIMGFFKCHWEMGKKLLKIGNGISRYFVDGIS